VRVPHYARCAAAFGLCFDSEGHTYALLNLRPIIDCERPHLSNPRCSR
jgi:hypothetical protein